MLIKKLNTKNIKLNKKNQNLKLGRLNYGKKSFYHRL